MIKLQTGATRREGGKEEGREEERFLERRGKQDMEKEKKKGKHRGGLFQAEVLSLQGLCIFQGQTDRNKTLAVHFLTYKPLERSRHYRAVTDVNTELRATQLAACVHVRHHKQVHIGAFRGGRLDNDKLFL